MLSEEKIKDAVEALKLVQIRCTARIISPVKLRNVLRKNSSKPFFHISVCGGTSHYYGIYRKDATVGYVKWDSKSRNFEYDFTRVSSRGKSWEGIRVDTENRHMALKEEDQLKAMGDRIRSERARLKDKYNITIHDLKKGVLSYQPFVEYYGEKYFLPARKAPYKNGMPKKLREEALDILRKRRAKRRRIEVEHEADDCDNI